MAKINITSPVGRIVLGSLYDANDTDAEGKPLVVKNGPNTGQPRVDYFFALAVPKNPGETHWAQAKQTRIDGTVNDWGQQIWAAGHQAFPQAAQAADFSWKIIDGDSQQPGKLFKGKPGKKPCENEGWPGHWIIKFSGGFPPKVYRQEGASMVQETTLGFVKAGYWVEVAFEVDSNKSQTSPGIYINHRMVCFRGYGPEITFGPDVASAGFGVAPLPPGASAMPPAGLPMPAGAPISPQAPGVPTPTPVPVAGLVPPTVPGGVPSIPGVPAPLAPAGFAPPQPPVAPAVPVVPNPGFLQVAPPAAPARQLTHLAQGASYEALIAGGWTDATLIQNGLMLA